jgi:hypothetical protein
MNHLSALIYRSRASKPQSDSDLFHLLAQARERNERGGLTGLLLYDRGWFFQWLEGPSAALGKTWNKIRRDPRHHELGIIADQSIPVRLFDNWSMRFAHRDRHYEALFDEFVAADADMLDDLHLNPEKTPAIMMAFRRLASDSRN